MTQPLDAWRVRLLAAVVFFAGVLPYLPALRADFLHFDDHEVLLNQAFLRDGSLEGIWRCLWPFPYREEPLPLRDLTYWLGFKLHGAWAPGFTLGNLLLHGVAAAALYGLARRLLGLGARLRPNAVEAAALAGALIFATHPAHVESVAWVSSRKDVLSAVFYLLAIRVWVEYLLATDVAKRRRLYLGALLVYACGLCSKASVVSLPGVLFAADLCLGPSRSWRARLLALAPFAVATLGFVKGYSALLRAWSALPGNNRILEDYPEGAAWVQTMVCTDFMAIGLYLRDAFVPWYARVFARPVYAEAWSDVVTLGALVTIAGLAGAAWLAWRSRLAGFLAAWFFLALVPFLNLIPTEIPYAARYGFLSSAAASLLLGWGAVLLAGRLGRPRRTQALGVALALGCGAAAFEVCGWSRAFVEPEALWSKVEARSPGQLHSAQGLGRAYALRVEGASPAELEELGARLERLLPTHNSLAALGMVRERQGRLDEALELYKRTANGLPGGSPIGFLLTARVLVARSAARDFPATEGGAEPEWRKALRVYARVANTWPAHAEEAHRLSAETLQRARRWDEARATWEAYAVRYGHRPGAGERAEAALRALEDAQRGRD